MFPFGSQQNSSHQANNSAGSGNRPPMNNNHAAAQGMRRVDGGAPADGSRMHNIRTQDSSRKGTNETVSSADRKKTLHQQPQQQQQQRRSSPPARRMSPQQQNQRQQRGGPPSQIPQQAPYHPGMNRNMYPPPGSQQQQQMSRNMFPPNFGMTPGMQPQMNPYFAMGFPPGGYPGMQHQPNPGWSPTILARPIVLPNNLPSSVYNAVQLYLRIKELKIIKKKLNDEPDEEGKNSMLDDSDQDKIDEELNRLLREKEEIMSMSTSSSSSNDRKREKRPTKESKDITEAAFTKKIYIPAKEYPNYNFIGLILGPRGKTQKLIEKESGVHQVAIRGEGSVPIEKVRMNPSLASDEPLHVIIHAPTEKSLNLATEMINKLLIPVEEGSNEVKRQQLRELAKIHGTLFDSVPQTDIFEGKASLRDTLKTLGKEKLKKRKRNHTAAIGLEPEEIDTEMQEFIEHLVEDHEEIGEIVPQEQSAQPGAPGTAMEMNPLYSMYDKYYDDALREVTLQFDKTHADMKGVSNGKVKIPPIPGVDFEEDVQLREIIMHVFSESQKTLLLETTKETPEEDKMQDIETKEDEFFEDFDAFPPYEQRMYHQKHEERHSQERQTPSKSTRKQSPAHQKPSPKKEQPPKPPPTAEERIKEEYEDMEVFGPEDTTTSYDDHGGQEEKPEELLEDAPWL